MSVAQLQRLAGESPLPGEYSSGESSDSTENFVQALGSVLSTESKPIEPIEQEAVAPREAELDPLSIALPEPAIKQAETLVQREFVSNAPDHGDARESEAVLILDSGRMRELSVAESSERGLVVERPPALSQPQSPSPFLSGRGEESTETRTSLLDGSGREPVRGTPLVEGLRITSLQDSGRAESQRGETPVEDLELRAGLGAGRYIAQDDGSEQGQSPARPTELQVQPVDLRLNQPPGPLESPLRSEDPVTALRFSGGPIPTSPPAPPPVVTPTAATGEVLTPGEALPLKVQWLAERGGGRARVDLHPPHLGRVELSVRVVGSEVEVAIVAHESAAQTLAQGQRDQLLQALSARDLRLSEFEVTDGGNSSDSGLADDLDGRREPPADGEIDLRRGRAGELHGPHRHRASDGLLVLDPNQPATSGVDLRV